MASEEKEIIKNEELNNVNQEPISQNKETDSIQNQFEQSTMNNEIKNEEKAPVTPSEDTATNISEPNSELNKTHQESLQEQVPSQLIQQTPSQLIQQTPSQLIQQAPSQLIQQTPSQLPQQAPSQLTQQASSQLTQIKKPETNLNQNVQQPTANSNPNILRKVSKITINIIFILLATILLAFTVFTLTHTNNEIISSGVSILNIDVSGLDREAATDKISNYIQESLGNNDIVLKHDSFETNIGPEQLETKVNVVNLIDYAFDIGSGNNIFSNSFKKLSLMINPVNITPTMTINLEQLETTLNDISTQLPDAVKQSDYYIDNNNLILTEGKSGVIIDVSTMKNTITSKLNDLSYINNPIEIATISKDPEKLNIDNIYNEIHKEATDARFDAETHIVYPEENGLDFTMSLDEVKALLNESKDEYTIPLKVLHPNITTNMIGMEAFPNTLSSFSTKYPASNKDRTTNLRLAANKVNGTVVLPGQTFSYNSVVGERTIAAGYKEAAVYQDGQVVQRIRWRYMPNIYDII